MKMSLEIRDFERFLQTILKPGTKICDISTYPIVPPGENYGGEILAVNVTTVNENVKHFVAKLTPSNEMLGVMFNIKLTFKREIVIYMDVIPTLINLQKEYNIPDNKCLQLFPKCYGARYNLFGENTNTEITKDALMLFENLKTKHYVMEDRMTGLDFELTEYFLVHLARFHALPIALKHIKPEEYNKIKCLNASSFGDSYTEDFKKYFISGVNDVINRITGLEKYAPKIAQLLDKGFKFEERYIKPDEKWGTLVHHDLWINNFLIRRNENGKFVDLKVYDFQLACFGSFAHDLVFFLFTSVKQDVFDLFYEKLLKIYYESFIECLMEFNINTDVYTWQSFIEEINHIGPEQISHIVIMMRPIYMQKNKLNDNSEMDEKELGAINDVDCRYHDKMRKNIEAFVEQKWL